MPAGPIVEQTLREMYPFHTEATIYHLKGSEIKKMYFSLRRFYSNGGSNLRSPQLNFGVREKGEDLQVQLGNGLWSSIDVHRLYYVVFDGWLSEHRYGQSYRLKDWVKTFANKNPVALESYQDLLVRYFPQVVAAHQTGQALAPQILLGAGQCRLLFN